MKLLKSPQWIQQTTSHLPLRQKLDPFRQNHVTCTTPGMPRGKTVDHAYFPANC